MKHKITIAVMAAALSMAASAASAGTLTKVSVTLSNSQVSQPTDVTVRFITATNLTGGAGSSDYLFMTNGFGGLVPTNGPCNSDIVAKVDGAPLPSSALEKCEFSGGLLQVQLKPGQVVPAGSAVEIVVDKARIRTSATSGTFSTTAFRTASWFGNAIDTPLTEPTYTITSVPPPAPVPTLSEWGMILFGTVLAGAAALTLHRRRRSV